MAVLAEYPSCHRKQSIRNKKCKCGEDLEKKKRAKKVRYWIDYQLSGKQRREMIGYSIEEARDANGKRRVQKREKRIFEILPEANMTFEQLAQWYLGLESVKDLVSFKRYEGIFKNFNAVFGPFLVGNIQPLDLENYQAKREKEGVASRTIDYEIATVKAAIRKAFNNDMVGAHILKAFDRVEKKLKKGSNVRKRTWTLEEYVKLVNASPSHFCPILITGYNTGMRKGELRQLRWRHVDREKMLFRLPKEITKEGKDKDIPINRHVKKALESLPRHLRHDFVFTFKGEPIRHKDSLKKAFERAWMPTIWHHQMTI